MLINKISASELTRKFIKSALLVGGPLSLPPAPVFLMHVTYYLQSAAEMKLMLSQEKGEKN